MNYTFSPETILKTALELGVPEIVGVAPRKIQSISVKTKKVRFLGCLQQGQSIEVIEEWLNEK